MKQFGFALCCLFLLVMTYALQHFKAIEYGYKIEALKSQRDGLVEMNRALRLEEASLRDPARIDVMARQLGLQSPQAGQVIRMDSELPDSELRPVMASVRFGGFAAIEFAHVRTAPSAVRNEQESSARFVKFAAKFLAAAADRRAAILSRGSGISVAANTPRNSTNTRLYILGGDSRLVVRRHLPPPGLSASFPLRQF